MLAYLSNLKYNQNNISKIITSYAEKFYSLGIDADTYKEFILKIKCNALESYKDKSGCTFDEYFEKRMELFYLNFVNKIIEEQEYRVSSLTDIIRKIEEISYILNLTGDDIKSFILNVQKDTYLSFEGETSSEFDKKFQSNLELAIENRIAELINNGDFADVIDCFLDIYYDDGEGLKESINELFKKVDFALTVDQAKAILQQSDRLSWLIGEEVNNNDIYIDYDSEEDSFTALVEAYQDNLNMQAYEAETEKSKEEKTTEPTTDYFIEKFKRNYLETETHSNTCPDGVFILLKSDPEILEILLSFEKEEGIILSEKEIADLLGVSEDRATEIRQERQLASMDSIAYIEEDSPIYIKECITDEDIDELEKNVDTNDLVKTMREYLNRAPIEDRRRTAIINRFGMYGIEPKLYPEIGNILGVTASRAQALVSDAIIKMRKTRAMYQMADYLDNPEQARANIYRKK